MRLTPLAAYSCWARENGLTVDQEAVGDVEIAEHARVGDDARHALRLAKEVEDLIDLKIGFD